MAQVNFLFDDDGVVISAANGNTTSAITAGDILVAESPTTSPFGTTVPGGVDYDEIEVNPVKFLTAASKTQGGRILGIALADSPLSTTTLSRVPVAMEGLFLSPVIDTTGSVAAGMELRAAEGQTTSGVTNTGTTTGPTSKERQLKIGIALTGANTDGHYILWKFTR